jgi:hypothetical protein
MCICILVFFHHFTPKLLEIFFALSLFFGTDDINFGSSLLSRLLCGGRMGMWEEGWIGVGDSAGSLGSYREGVGEQGMGLWEEGVGVWEMGQRRIFTLHGGSVLGHGLG